MTSGLEFEEKNVELAVEKACKELNLSKEELEYDVLSYGSTGIFGLVGSKKAKIRVNHPRKNVIEDKWDKLLENIPSEPILEKYPIQTEKPAEKAEDQQILDETVDTCKQVLQRIIDTITTDTAISVEKKSDHIFFDVKGENPAVLIGKKGQTLEAIQYLIEKVANKGNDQRVRVQVDVEGYLKTRRLNLERLATRLAEKAVRTGKPMTIGQMNAHDRRIVHLALKNDGSVRTQSLGDGAYRKLMIYPKTKERGSGRRMSARYG